LPIEGCQLVAEVVIQGSEGLTCGSQRIGRLALSLLGRGRLLSG
jgi:L-serine deaminase